MCKKTLLVCLFLGLFCCFSFAQNIDLISKDKNLFLKNAKEKLSKINENLETLKQLKNKNKEGVEVSIKDAEKVELQKFKEIVRTLPEIVQARVGSSFTIDSIDSTSISELTEAIDKEIAKAGDTSIDIPIGMDMQVVNGKFEDTRNAAALLGIQVAKEEKYFVSAYLKTSLSDTIAGRDKVFGNFLLEPTRGGTSFVISGNVTTNWPWSNILFGPSARAGVVSTRWEILKDPDNSEETILQGYDGNVIFIDFGAMIASKVYDYSDDKKFQIGMEISLGIRIIGGDLGKSDQSYDAGSEPENKFAPETFRLDPRVLGSDKNVFWLFPQISAFIRLNNVCPYVKLAYQSSDDNIRGLSGWRAIFGVKLMTTAFNDTY